LVQIGLVITAKDVLEKTRSDILAGLCRLHAVVESLVRGLEGIEGELGFV
jgi:hypothetical protein